MDLEACPRSGQQFNLSNTFLQQRSWAPSAPIAFVKHKHYAREITPIPEISNELRLLMFQTYKDSHKR
uniref:Uncharacterized protein n=1 Tax=Sphaerodactylus townsendi TaxID=933632 RepID=A0ACB8EVM4_9SAUR